MSDERFADLEKRIQALENQTNFRLLLVALAVLLVGMLTVAGLVF